MYMLILVIYMFYVSFYVRGAMRSQKEPYARMRMSPAPVRDLAKAHLSRVSHRSCLSANDKDDKEMILGGCAQILGHLPYG